MLMIYWIVENQSLYLCFANIKYKYDYIYEHLTG